MASPGRPWEPVLERRLGPGALVAVPLPAGPASVPPEVLHRLDPAERELVREARGYRQKQLAGGRLAAAQALRAAGLPRGPVLCGERGAPLWPPGCRGSLAHKDRLAIAWAEPAGDDVTVGIDLEELEPQHPGIAAKVLTEAERRRHESLPADQRWGELVRCFAVKEALYKALAPRLRRYVSFQEAEVVDADTGAPAVRLALRHGEGPFEVAAAVAPLAALARSFLVATVHLTPASGPGAPG